MDDEMQHNPTDQPPLPPKQEAAINALVAGKTVTETAKLIDVDRTTVHRWRTKDAAFRAEFNRRRRELQDATQVKLLRMAHKATAVLEDAINEGDSRVALAVLRGVGAFTHTAPDIGPEDVGQVSQEMFDEATSRRRRS